MVSKNRWGDLLEEEEDLPPSTVSGPDAKGITTKVEYVRNDKGDILKRITKNKTIKIQKKVFEVAQERRRHWQRFGDAATERETDAITGQATEDIPFERIRPAKQTQEEKAKQPDFQSAMAGSDKAVIVGSLRDMLYKRRMERQLLAAKGLIAAPERPPEEEGPGGLPPAGGAPGKWQPRTARVAAEGADGPARRRDENSVRVSNLSEETTEDDLHELFGAFGTVQRVFLAKDRETGESRGFAFVNFIRREDAQRAINRLDGHGYDNLILKVEWATPREQR